jgi:hypothetical protein
MMTSHHSLRNDNVNRMQQHRMGHSKLSFSCVGFEVLTAVVKKSSIFWDITPCSLLKVN